MTQKLLLPFIGPDGLRAGWRLILFATVVGVIGYAEFVAIPQPSCCPVSPGQVLLRSAELAFPVFGATALMAVIERRNISSYGLRGPRWYLLFPLGAVAGFAVPAAFVACLKAAGYLVFGDQQLNGAEILRDGSLWFVAFTIVSIGELALFQGYALTMLARLIGFGPAAIFLAFAFGFAHVVNPYVTATSVIVLITAGAFLTVVLRITGSLWWGIGFLASWNWTETFLFGTPYGMRAMKSPVWSVTLSGDPQRTGGMAGFEGSEFMFPIACIGLAIAYFTLRSLWRTGPKVQA
jgi:membrane protease YdiL (CAAX protease family)